MAKSQYGLEMSFVAENDLTSNQYYFVELGGSANEVDVCDGATDKPLGVLQNKPDSGEAANVRVEGSTKVVASGSISKGAYVGTDGNGKATAKSSDQDIVRGIALNAASSDGDIIEIKLIFDTLSTA